MDILRILLGVFLRAGAKNAEGKHDIGSGRNEQ